MLYDGSVIAKETNVISIADSKETLMLEEETFWLQTSHPNTDQSASSHVKIEAPREIPKEKVFVITALKNDLQKFKRKEIADNVAQMSYVTTIAPGMYMLDPVILAPKVKNNRKAYEYYLKHTIEQAAILKEVVEQAKSQNPLDSVSYSSCMYVKLIQELLGYVRDSFPDIHKPNLGTLGLLVYNLVTTCFGETTSRGMGTLRGTLLLRVIQIVLCNDQVAKIMGYGDHQKGNVIILRVYYVEGLGHNLFSVGQSHDSDLKVAFRKHTCFVCNMEGVDLLLGSRGTNLLEPTLHEMTPKTPSSGLVPNPPPSAPFVPPLRHEWDLVFQPVVDEFFSPPASVASLVLIEEAPAPVELTGLPSSITVDQDAPTPSTSQTTV
nr:retrovirus-related Pol polyprotein from transposon TNT 1-94 [Tanacetum cinerariifolium]